MVMDPPKWAFKHSMRRKKYLSDDAQNFKKTMKRPGVFTSARATRLIDKRRYDVPKVIKAIDVLEKSVSLLEPVNWVGGGPKLTSWNLLAQAWPSAHDLARRLRRVTECYERSVMAANDPCRLAFTSK